MAVHKLPKGKRLIQGLVQLGEVLGYYVKTEFPVENVRRGPPPAVDVAWFSDGSQKFPLMIYEIESSMTNTIANNPLKVFAQERVRLEKPLFFFHIIVEGHSASTRLKNLERQYGTHNYGIYVLGNHGAQKLIQDILTQHRKIRTEVNYFDLYKALSDKYWHGMLDPALALREASKLRLSIDSRLLDYVWLTLDHPQLINELKTVIEEESRCEWSSIEEFSSYIGNQLGVLPLCALMIRYSQSATESERWATVLHNWLQCDCAMSLSYPILGTSPDSDNFFLGIFPAFVALCSAVAGEQGEFREFRYEMCDTLLDLLEQLGPCLTGINIASWICHLAARYEMDIQYNQARDFINEYGGIDENQLYSPPSITYDEIEEHWQTGNIVACPDIHEFRKRAFSQQRILPADPCQLALTAVCAELFISEWSEPILSNLWKYPEVLSQ